MYRIIFKLYIVYSIVSPSLAVQNNYRKYNMDEESYKLYGEDFKTVLKRFRRTPDYLKILQDKLGDLKTSAKELSLLVLQFYIGKLEERVNEVIPKTTDAGAPPNIKRERDKTFHTHRYRRQDKSTTEVVEDSLQKIHNLDNYKVFESQLSVAEQNSMKDLGFEFAGKIVHSIIENMAPKSETETKEQAFTHVPDSDENKIDKTTKTTHPPEHAFSLKEDDAETVTVEGSFSTEANIRNKDDTRSRHISQMV